VDLTLYGRVLRRFWWLVVPGVLLASTLALLSLVRVSPDGVAYRNPPLWESQTLLLLTQPGFPWGRTVLPASGESATSKYADAGRFSSLTALYAEFATSDEVKKMMLRRGAQKDWKIDASPFEALPVIALSGQAHSAKDAVAATAYGRQAFMTFVSSRQHAAGIPPAERIRIQILKRSTPPLIIEPVKKTLPIMIFLAGLTAAVGLAFVLENLRPPVRALASTADPDQGRTPVVRKRRTA
jgi:hypothetical protein